VLREHANQILNLRQAAEVALREVRDLDRGKITISANEHTVFYLLPVIERFRERYPNIKVEVQRGVASRIPKEITAREVELGVVSFAPNEPSLRSIPVMTDSLTLIVAPGHRLAGASQVGIKELGDEAFIAHNAPSPYRRRVVEAFEKHRVRLNIAIELPSLEAIKLLVERGAGVALVPRLTAVDEISRNRLRALSVKELKLERKLHIIYRRSSALSHAAKAFIDVAKELRKQDDN
jgi:DNA-binding transcriptional LysR family regulator